MSDSPQTPPFPEWPRRRHGCLTAWLIFVIIVNAITAGVTPLFVQITEQASDDKFKTMTRVELSPSPIGTGIVVICALANIVFAAALFRWRRWAFYGFFLTSIVMLVSNLSLGVGVGRSLAGLLGVAVLYGVLNIGNEANRGWPQLK